MLSACSNPTPPIAEGLPKTFGPTPDFDARMRQRFPVGSAENKLITELHTENLAIEEIHDPSSQYRRAAYESHVFPCKETWTVWWSAERGQIISIEGRYSGQLCL